MPAIRPALGAMRRAPLLTVLSVTTIGFSLFAFGLFGLVALNVHDALGKAEERVEIRAFAADGTANETLTRASEDIAKYPEVLRVDVVTKEQALEKARTELGEFKDVFEAGILPASLDVRLKPGFRAPVTVKRVADRIHRFEFVDDVRFGEEWISQLYHLRNVAIIAGFTLGLAFAAVAIIVIGATIRMAVLARSNEISIMRLVGATDAFIRRPFLVEGAIKGLLGGLLALALTWVATLALERYLHLETAFFDRRLATIGVVFCAMLGWFGSGMSVGRHLRHL
jgi:cell division transport system permease protein